MLCDDVEWWNGQGGDGRETQEVEDICMHRLPRMGSSKESDCNAGDATESVLIPELGRFPGVGNGNPLYYSFMEHSMDREAW